MRVCVLAKKRLGVLVRSSVVNRAALIRILVKGLSMMKGSLMLIDFLCFIHGVSGVTIYNWSSGIRMTKKGAAQDKKRQNPETTIWTSLVGSACSV